MQYHTKVFVKFGQLYGSKSLKRLSLFRKQKKTRRECNKHERWEHSEKNHLFKEILWKIDVFSGNKTRKKNINVTIKEYKMLSIITVWIILQQTMYLQKINYSRQM